jgi:hypothetical protein
MKLVKMLDSEFDCSSHIKEEISGACSTRGGDEKCIQYFGFENLNGRDHSKDVGVDGEIIRGPFENFVVLPY